MFYPKDVRLYYKIFPRHVNEHYFEKRKRLINKFITKDSLILDVGCGKGRQLAYLKDCHKFGSDSSRFMIKSGERTKNLRLLLGDACNLPFKDGSFNLVYSVVVLHHIADPYKIKTAIRELIRVVKKGHNVIIWDHNSYNLYWRFLLKRIPWDKDTRLVRDMEYQNAAKNVSFIKISKTGFVPDFCPKILLNLFKLLEHYIEDNFLGKFLAAHTLVIIKK